ncbi:hypothetical protein GCM10027184_16470 [Saccharothrix stipae]
MAARIAATRAGSTCVGTALPAAAVDWVSRRQEAVTTASGPWPVPAESHGAASGERIRNQRVCLARPPGPTGGRWD